jgi:dTDP-4-amino-4,6-dideoxygalactose transaminase
MPIDSGPPDPRPAPIRFQAPTFPPSEAIERYFRLARDARWFTNFGPCDELLRSRLSEATGRPCVLVANATLGLIVAIAALRERAPEGATEVLVPSFAFAASAQCAVWNGLDPVFVDVAPDHWQLEPEALSLALEERPGRVAAVVALSSLGVPPPPEVRARWESACTAAGVPLIVDSAAGFGASAADGVPIGGQGDAEVVSFHALKPLSAGEGGAVFCRDEELAAELTRRINFSFDARHRVQRADALNAKLSELAAAVALASLDELPATIERRRTLAGTLRAGLPEGFGLQLGHELGTWQFFPTLAPDREHRNAVLAEAERRGIALRTYYDPLHEMPAFAGCAQADELETTRELGERMLSLPMAVDLAPGQVAAIVELVESVVGASTRS